MKLQELKDWVNLLSEEDLKKFLVCDSDEKFAFGYVKDIVQATEDLCWVDNYPPALFTLKDLLHHGYGPKEIEDLEVAVFKGSFIIKF
ncbi:MAG: hypothetical protein ACOH2V_01070 [Candidatus Saccharimonadaceae bacterium]